jgi:endo-1,4-beta-xylanase
MRKLTLLVLAGALAAGAAAQTQSSPSSPSLTLKDAYRDAFLVGVAINRAQFTAEDQRGVKIIQQQFNSVSPENVLKWESVHPKPGEYDFAAADKYVEFGEANHMFIIGHTLVWHNQTPKWVFEDDNGNPVTRQELLKRMKDHIKTVVGHYKGRIKGWDVVNEAIADDGTMRESPWMKIIGDDYIEKAFEYAHKADKKAELYYNDYSLENEPKRKGALALIAKLKAKGIPVKAVGLQGHDNLEWPTVEQQDATISAFQQLGVKVNITELDVTVLPSPNRQPTAEVTATAESKPNLNPYAEGLPEAVQQQLANRYAELFHVFEKHADAIDRVTFWGVTDADSWRNDWPARGRTDYPLLFDRSGAPKPAFQAVIQAATAESAKK